MSYTSSVSDHILSLVWVFFLLFPTGNFFYVSIPILLLLLYDNKGGGIKKGILPMLLLLFITLVVNITESYMGFKPIVRLVTIAVVFITFASLRGRRILFPYIFFATVFILLSQICYLYNIASLTSIFNRFYDLSGKGLELYGISVESIDIANVASGGTRLGGIYYNPNNCASYISVIYAMGLCELNKIRIKHFVSIVFVSLVLFSLIISGSRTSLFVFVASTLYYLHVRGKSLRKYWPLFILAIVVILIVINRGTYDELRMFKVSEGMDNSFGIKMRFFGNYLSSADDLLQFLFGAGDIEVTVAKYHSPLPGTDCDFGNIFIVFGLFFYFFYIVFYCRLFGVLSPIHKVILIVLLWSFSNSLLISYRMCPVWFLSLGVCYKQSVEP